MSSRILLIVAATAIAIAGVCVLAGVLTPDDGVLVAVGVAIAGWLLASWSSGDGGGEGWFGGDGFFGGDGGGDGGGGGGGGGGD